MPKKRTSTTTTHVSEAAGAEKPKRVRAPRKKAEAVAAESANGTSNSITQLAEAVGPSVSVSNGFDRREIARLAYSYWEARGCQGGSSDEDWLRAEQELRARHTVAANG